ELQLAHVVGGGAERGLRLGDPGKSGGGGAARRLRPGPVLPLGEAPGAAGLPPAPGRSLLGAGAPARGGPGRGGRRPGRRRGRAGRGRGGRGGGGSEGSRRPASAYAAAASASCPGLSKTRASVSLTTGFFGSRKTPCWTAATASLALSEGSWARWARARAAWA